MKTYVLQQEEQMVAMDTMLENQQAMEQMMKAPGSREENQRKIMFSILVDQAKMVDKIFLLTGIEIEEMEAEIQAKNLIQDPEFKKVMQAYMMKMQMKAMMAQQSMGMGGMGGMPGMKGPPPGMPKGMMKRRR
mmetsp:Transcript_3592/g.6102  ORF Transcript_3592/g.6102 Transcript_3592/m.6102 type:complete len:133 (-) Transcript_3592:52-450(-)